MGWKQSVSRLGAALLAAATAGQAEAGWMRAESRHFVVYGEGSAGALRAYAERLEKFDKAARLVLREDDPDVGDGNRIHIYQLPGLKEVRALHGQGRDSNAVAGFYIPRYSGSVAFVPRATDDRSSQISADSALFHEYAHHLMWQDMAQPYPNWYVEGFAELIGTPRFSADGSVILGVAPPHRASALFSRAGMSIRTMLEAQPDRLSPVDRAALYAKGWLLTHFLTFEPGRAGQLPRYLDALAEGRTAAEAAAVLGDLDQLERQLNDYVVRTRIRSVTIAPSVLAIGPVKVEPLSEAAALAMPVHIKLRRGLDRAEAAALLPTFRALAERHGDGLVQRTLAELALVGGDAGLALQAAQAALRAGPDDSHANLLHGRALLAAKADAVAARKAFLAANRLDTEDPEPLVEYYRSFPAKAAPRDAIDGLHHAAALMPGDSSVRVNSALLWLVAGNREEARRALLPVAYNPHGGARAAQMRALLDRLKDGDPAAALRGLAEQSRPPAP